MYRVILLATLLALGLQSPARAAFETLGQSTQASAMAGAYAVHAADATALWYNPAGLAQTGQRQVLLDYARLFPGLDVGPDINSWSLGYVQHLAGGTVGLGLAGLSADFYSENALALGYGLQVGSRLQVGLGLRFLSWSADGYRDPSGARDPDRSGSGLGVDLGLRAPLVRWREGLFSAAFVGQNLNEPDISEGGGTGIPRHLVLGLAYDDAVYGLEANMVWVDGDQRLRVGGEYKMGGRYDVRLRLGASGLAGDGAGGQVDGGLGLKRGSWLLNYAYGYAAEIDADGSQRFSLAYQF
ncbi:MAG: hypothetical protein GKR89_10300 [Candidatus Latescibacteria bacterium]|nr:hypothetical protein [Candidatus Latescibacterota bacterium]